MAHRLLHCKCRVEGVVKLIKCMGSELTHAGVDWMRKKSVYVSDIARLAKFWSQTVLYIGCGNGKSFFLELVAVSAAMEVEGTRKDHSQAFKRFLSYMVRMDQTRIVFIDFYSESEIPENLMQQTPLLLNPTNPFQNMFECVDKDYESVITSAARVTLAELKSGCEDLVRLFYPQNYERRA